MSALKNTVSNIHLPNYTRFRRLHPLPFCLPACQEEDSEDERDHQSRGRNKHPGSDDSDSDQENRRPLQKSIHHNRQRYRTDSHPDIMTKGTRTSGRIKGKKQKNSREDEQAIVKRQQEQLDKLQKENQMFKEKEELNKKRAAIAVHSKKNSGQQKALMGVMRKIVNSQLWKRCKFIKNKQFFLKACHFVLDKLNLQEMEGLKDAELEAAQDSWIEAHKSSIASLLNDRRNYVIQQLGKEVRDRVVAGKLDEIPNVEEMRKLVTRDGMDGNATKEDKANLDAKFELYWDVLIPIVAGCDHWPAKVRRSALLSFAEKEEQDDDEDDGVVPWLVHPSDEAFLLIAWENSFNRWVHKATVGNAFDENDPQAQTKYSSSPHGLKAFGQWDPEGIKLFSDKTDEIRKQRLPDEELEDPHAEVNFIKDLETAALERIRKAHNITDDGPPKKKRKRSGKENMFDDEECDMDDADAW